MIAFIFRARQFFLSLSPTGHPLDGKRIFSFLSRTLTKKPANLHSFSVPRDIDKKMGIRSSREERRKE